MPSSQPILSEHGLYSMIANDLFTRPSTAGSDRIGLEVELFPFHEIDGRYWMVPLHAVDGCPSMSAWLSTLAGQLAGVFSTDPDTGPLIRLPDGARLTLEPAGQLEYSSAPAGSVREAVENLLEMVGRIGSSAAEHGIVLETSGYNNFCPEEEHHLQVPKPRYRAMDRYFQTIGPYGRRMMRSTCSLQVNLDFGDGGSTSERWRLANMITPSLNALFANSPHVHEGRHYRSYRYEIWRRTDRSRTGRLYDTPDLDPVADYLRFSLDAAVMFITMNGGEYMVPERPLSFRQWMVGSRQFGYPDSSDWHTHLSTLFPDVRARGWMELRSMDCIDRQWWPVPAAMTATLLYNSTLRREALYRLESRDRCRHDGEHEHDGFWRSDVETGRELLELAIPYMAEKEYAELAQRYLTLPSPAIDTLAPLA